MTEHELLEIEKRGNAATRVNTKDKKTMQEERKVIITLTETEDGEITLSLNLNFIFDVDSVKNLEQTVIAMIGQAAVRNECLVVKCIPKQ